MCSLSQINLCLHKKRSNFSIRIIERNWGQKSHCKSSAFLLRLLEFLTRDHPFRTSVNFHDFWPLHPYRQNSSKMLMKGIFYPYVLQPLTVGPWGHPSLPKTCWRLKWMVPYSRGPTSRSQKVDAAIFTHEVFRAQDLNWGLGTLIRN